MAGVVRTMPSHASRSSPRVVKAPRPPNAWIIYRSDKVHQLPPLEPGQPRRAQAEVSKMISNMWANESEQTRQEYERRAEEAKAAHALKYPGYRFKPMKKEEKRAQREQEQNERLAKRRDQRRSGSTPDRTSITPTTQYTATLPQYYTSINMPINLAPLGQPIAPPLPYPFMSFYPSQTRFGPAGPTPPVSAAASPTDPSPSPEASCGTGESQNIHHGSENVDPSLSGNTDKPANAQAAEASKPAATPATASEPTVFPSFNTATFASGQEWPHAPTATIANNGTLTPALTPSPLWQDVDSTRKQEQRESSQAVPMENVSFNFEPFQLSNLDNLLSGSTDDPLSAFVNATGDPGIFQLINMDPNDLMAHPTGEIEVSLGDSLDLSSFPPELFLSDTFAIPLPEPGHAIPQNFFAPQTMAVTTSDGIPRVSSHGSSPSSVSYNPDDYLDFGASSIFGDTNDIPIMVPSVDSVNPTTAVQNAEVYVPPAGASNSSYRRAGGSWTKQFVNAQTPSAPRATGMTQSQ